MKPVSVSIIGSGNLAWHLAPALDNTGYAVREIYSAHHKNAAALASRLYQSEAVENLDFSESQSRLFILAVSDDAIREVALGLKLPAKATVIHTSGSQPIELLEGVAACRGVFYPLQTFTKNRRVDFSSVPFLVEGNDETTEKMLVSMGKSLSTKVIKTSSEDRRRIHLAAVFSSNFTNHMLSIAKEVLADKKFDFALLKPLIAETINKSLEIGPEKAQTGPARRGDLETLDRHMELLSADESVAAIYKLVSQHIVDRYN